MTRLCKECGSHAFAWDDDAGSDICTQCGTLSDPSQTLLTHTPLVSETATHLWDVPGYAVLKSHCSRGNNWNLSGQGKEIHHKRNHLSMTHFLNSLCTSINAPGLSPRATNIFNQAMATGKFRWGRRAKLVAGASLAIALREYRRPDSLNDIAYLLDERYPILVRTLTTLVSLLNISLTPVDPSVHIPPLLTYLSSLSASVPSQPQSQPTHQLPASLISQLKSVPLRAASKTAVALSTCLARLGPEHMINSLPSPPTAIALFILAIEAELRAPIDHLGELAECLGARCHKSSRGVVMTRYKLIQDEIATWVDQIPWLGKYEQRTTKSGTNRAKTSKRTVVARGMADVLQFQEGIWRNKSKPIFTLYSDDADEDDTDDISGCAVPESTTRPAKRQKVAHRALEDATQFLLDPFSSSLPKYESHVGSISHPSVRQCVSSNQNDSLSDSSLQELHCHETQQQPILLSAHPPSLPSYILTVPELPTLHMHTLPTRLQALTAMRGAEQNINDDELFEEGELEGMLRTEEEAEELREKLLGSGIWEEKVDEDEEEDSMPDNKRNQRKSRPRGQKITASLEGGDVRRRKSRVDLDALARFMKSPSSNMDDENNDEDNEDEDERPYSALMLGLQQLSDEGHFGLSYNVDERGHDEDSPISRSNTLRTPTRAKSIPSTPSQNEEVVVSEWHPLSPEAGFGGPGRYDEEYN